MFIIQAPGLIGYAPLRGKNVDWGKNVENENLLQLPNSPSPSLPLSNRTQHHSTSGAGAAILFDVVT